MYTYFLQNCIHFLKKIISSLTKIRIWSCSYRKGYLLISWIKTKAILIIIDDFYNNRLKHKIKKLFIIFFLII